MNVKRKLSVLFGITLLFATASFAQQMKTDYDRSADAQTALVHATTVIDNERVRVWDISLAQGQSTDFGRYEYDFVTMFLVGGKFRTTSENGGPTVTERRFGEAVYGHKGAKQEDELISGGPARLIVVELKVVTPLREVLLARAKVPEPRRKPPLTVALSVTVAPVAACRVPELRLNVAVIGSGVPETC